MVFLLFPGFMARVLHSGGVFANGIGLINMRVGLHSVEAWMGRKVLLLLKFG